MKRILIIINIVLAVCTISFIGFSVYSHPHVKDAILVENVTGLQDQIKIVFSRPMNQNATIQSFTISPPIKGNTSWTQNTLFFTPKEPFHYGQTYTVKLTTQAQDVYGNHLKNAYTKAIPMTPHTYVYISHDHKLLLNTLGGEPTPLTSHEKVYEFTMSPVSHTIAYIAQGKSLDEYQMYVITDPRNPQPKEVAQTYKDIRYINITPDGQFVYFMARAPLQKRVNNDNGSFSIYNMRLYVYDVNKDRVQEVHFPKDTPFFYSYSLTPEGQGFLLLDEFGRYYLHSRHTDKYILLGSFGDYGGGTQRGDMLVLTNHLSDDSNAVFVYNGTATRVSHETDTTALPSISNDGQFVSYSYINKDFVRTPQKTTYNIKVMRVKDTRTVLDTKLSSKDFSQTTFSPDGRYLTAEIHHVNKNPDMVIYPIKENVYYDDEKITTALYDLETGKQLPQQINGYNIIWME